MQSKDKHSERRGRNKTNKSALPLDYAAVVTDDGREIEITDAMINRALDELEDKDSRVTGLMSDWFCPA